MPLPCLDVLPDVFALHLSELFQVGSQAVGAVDPKSVPRLPRLLPLLGPGIQLGGVCRGAEVGAEALLLLCGEPRVPSEVGVTALLAPESVPAFLRPVVAQSVREGFPGPSAAKDGCSEPPWTGLRRVLESPLVYSGRRTKTAAANKRRERAKPFPF